MDILFLVEYVLSTIGRWLYVALRKGSPGFQSVMLRPRTDLFDNKLEIEPSRIGIPDCLFEEHSNLSIGNSAYPGLGGGIYHFSHWEVDKFSNSGENK